MNPERRVLYVAHEFPPAGGSGPNRALAFSRYLPRYGWRPIVLTTGPRWATNLDAGSELQVSPDLQIVRTRSFETLSAPPEAVREPASRLAGSQSRLRRHVGHARRFPDAHVGWAPFAIRAGLDSIRQDRVQALFSTAGPYTSHLVALVLHRLTKLPWIAELRDGWYRWNQAIFRDYPGWRAALDRSLEGAVVRRAGAVVLMTEMMADSFRTQYAGRLPADHFRVIPNGFDPAQYAALPPYCADGSRFRVLHAGALYYGRSIEAFLDAAGQLAELDADFKEAFRLSQVGPVDQTAGGEIDRQVIRHGLQRQVQTEGFQPHADILRAMRQADLLLALVNTTSGAEGTVPGKVYEYLAVGRPILAITPPAAVAAAIVQRTRSGWVAPAHDVSAIRARLADAFATHRSGTTFEPDATQLGRYDRSVLAGDLAALLDRALALAAH